MVSITKRGLCLSMITSEGNKWTEACSHLFFMPNYMQMCTGTIISVLSWRGHGEEKSVLRILIKTEVIFGLKLQNSSVK